MERHFCLDDSPTFRMMELDEVDSTNSFVRHLHAPADRRLTLVTTEFQSAGRGAGTNRWESARGENLLFSLRVMPHQLPVHRVFAISEAAALSVAEALDAFTEGRRFTVKWPNDVYFADSKVAGILIENDLQGSLVSQSIIGIGINVNQRRFVSDAPNPLSLAGIVGRDVERRFVLEQFMECFTRHLKQLDEGSFDVLHETYMSRLYRCGERHKFSDEMGVFCAKIVDVEPSGHLLLVDDEGKLRRYEFKEVQHII